MLDPHKNDHPFAFNLENTTDTSSYDTWQPINYSSRAQKTAQNYKSWKSMGALRLNAAEEDSPSGVCSPPLWKTTTTSNPPQSPTNFRNLSPASRTQAIVRGQRELMDMVRNMPESCYELSLKDLVERPRMVKVDEDDGSTDGLVRREDGKVKKKKKKKKPMVMRSGSMDSEGFLLNMVFPISLGSNKKNHKTVMANKNKNKMSDSAEGECSNEKQGSTRPCVDKDWWKKRVLGGSGGSESGASSVISGSIKSSSGSSTSSCSSRSSSRRKTISCWSFIVLKKKRQD